MCIQLVWYWELCWYMCTSYLSTIKYSCIGLAGQPLHSSQEMSHFVGHTVPPFPWCVIEMTIINVQYYIVCVHMHVLTMSVYCFESYGVCQWASQITTKSTVTPHNIISLACWLQQANSCKGAGPFDIIKFTPNAVHPGTDHVNLYTDDIIWQSASYSKPYNIIQVGV